MKLALILMPLAGLIFLALDMIWLLYVARSVYVEELGPLLKPQPNLGAAAAFYVLYMAGLTFFVLIPAAEAGSVWKALGLGAFFGLVAYGTYDLTNLATLKGFSARIAIIDMVWGAIVTGITSAGTILLARMLRLLA